MEQVRTDARRVSYAVFGNEKSAEVIRAVARRDGVFTATDITNETGIAHGLVRAVLLRLSKDDLLLRALPKTGSRMGQQFYERQLAPVWDQLVSLAVEIVGEPSDQ